MKIFNKLIFWIFGIAFLVSCKDDMAPQLPEPVVETPEVGERPELKQLHVDGRYLVDADGRTVNLHGFAQTYSPFFNNNAWGNYDVDACLRYNQLMTDRVLAAGWEVNFIRQHMDPYWSSPGASSEAEAHMFYNEERFRKYLDIVFVPMAEFAISRGFYVVMRPPGVCPEEIKVGDKYQEYLVKIWDIVTEHPTLKNNPYVMFELANEPVRILDPEDGSVLDVNTDKDKAFTQLSMYFQKIVDTIRENGCNNILWIPGLGYQSQYAGYVEHPINDPVNNYGFAIHVYPGWYGSDGENEDGGVGNNGGYVSFQNGWDNQVGPVAETHPIMVTEMDWAPKKYNASWGKATTGEAGGAGFGANFKLITDNSGNVSWLLFTGQEYMAEFVDVPGVEGEYTFLNDPEACPWPIYHWYQEYAGVSAEDYGNLVDIKVSGATKDKDGKYSMTVSTQGSNFYIVTTGVYDSGKERVLAGVKYESSKPDIFTVSETGAFEVKKEGTGVLKVTYNDKTIEINVTVTDLAFLLDSSFKRLAGENSLFSAETNTLTITGTEIYGWGDNDVNTVFDLSKYKYMVLDLKEPVSANADFSISKKVWDSPSYNLRLKPTDTDTRYVIALTGLKANTRTDFGEIEMDKISVVGFQGAMVTSTIKIDRVFVTNDWPYEGKTLDYLEVDGIASDDIIYVNQESSFTVKAVFTDGTNIDVTSLAEYTCSNSNFKIEGGKITASSEGYTDITIKFGQENNEKELTVSNIRAIEQNENNRYFHLNDGFKNLVNGSSSYSSGILSITGTEIFGWGLFEPGIDLSAYKYLVVDMKEQVAGNAKFIVSKAIWTSPAHEIILSQSSTRNVICLGDYIETNSFEEQGSVDVANVGVIGFQGANADLDLKPDMVFATNEWPYGENVKVESLEVTGLSDNSIIPLGVKQDFTVTAKLTGGTKVNVTSIADYELTNSSFKVGQRKIWSDTEGYTDLTIKFGPENNVETVTIKNIKAGTPTVDDLFPLTNEGFKVAININGNTSAGNIFNASDKSLTLNSEAGAGWSWGSPLDLSGHKYLIVELEKAMTDNRIGVVVENEIGHACKTYFVGNKEVIIELDNMVINWPDWSSKLGQKVDPSSITAVAFNIDYLATNNPEFKIKEVRFAEDYPGVVTDIKVKGFASTIGNGKTMNIKVEATVDGSTRNVTYEAKYSSSNPGVVSFISGKIKALTTGTSELAIEYQGKQFKQSIEVKNVDPDDLFPLLGGYFNPNLAGDYTFDFENKILTAYGWNQASGWSFDPAINLNKRYLIAKYKGDTNEVNLFFGEKSIWDMHYCSGNAVDGSDGFKYVVVDLDTVNTTNVKGTVTLNKQSIKVVGLKFPFEGATYDFYIDSVYLSDTDPTASSNRSN